MIKSNRLFLISVCVVSLFTKMNISSAGNLLSDSGIPALPENLSKLIEQRVATARLEGQVSAYAQATKALGGLASNPSSWMRSWWSKGRTAVYLGIGAGLVYGGYLAYKKFEWFRNIVGYVNDKLRGAAQNWLDITWIKERVTGITNRIADLAQQIAGLGSGQERMQRDLNAINDQTRQIISQLQDGHLRDANIDRKLISIEEKVDNLRNLVEKNQTK